MDLKFLKPNKVMPKEEGWRLHNYDEEAKMNCWVYMAELDNVRWEEE